MTEHERAATGARRQPCRPLGQSQGDTPSRMCASCRAPACASCASSRVYATAPLGPGRQAPYLNAVLLIEANIAPAALLRLLKRIERRAGRRLGRVGDRAVSTSTSWTMAAGAWAGRRARRERGRLILPHPEMHRRAFVLVPLLEIAPHWRHPVLGVAGAHASRPASVARGRRQVSAKPLISRLHRATSGPNESALRKLGSEGVFACSITSPRGIIAWRA